MHPTDSRDPAAQASAEDLHRALVDGLAAGGFLRTPEVEAAFRAVPRHHFLPGEPLLSVYSDQHIVTKDIGGQPVSSSSQPSLMALMLEQLALRPGMRVLEVGAGTGYNAALMARLVAPGGEVTSVDIDEDLVEGARAHLAAAGAAGVRALQADGMRGYPPGAPYDRIVLTVGAWDIVPAWRDQLAPGGMLLAPLAILPGVMYAVLFARQGESMVSVAATPCGFLPLRGPDAPPSPWAWPPPQITVTPRDGPPVREVAVAIEKSASVTEVRWPWPE